jgi:hypothetical protein
MTALLGRKLRRVGVQEGYLIGSIAHWCPGCGISHAFAIDKAMPAGERWTWDGDIKTPTFTPERNIAWGGEIDPKFKLYGAGRCHYSLTAGVLVFFDDCSHELRGHMVPLPDLPGHLLEMPIRGGQS